MKSKSMLLFAALFLFVSLVAAQDKPEGKGFGRRGMMGKLNLTDEQRTKITDYKLELQKKQITLRAKAQTTRIELKQILNAEKIDKAAIEKKLNEISKIQIDQKMNFINHWEQVNQMLSPEQKEVWKKTLKLFDSPMRQRMMKRAIRNGRFNDRGMRGPGRLRGEIPEFNRPDSELAALLAQQFDMPGFEDEEEYTDETEDSFDDFFEMGNYNPEPPQINPPDNVMEN